MNNYTYSFTTLHSPKEVFEYLLNVKQWWLGFYEETIKGSSQQLNDEFSFYAGSGMHITKQKLIELIPDEKIVWQVTESELTFLKDQNEWKGTKFGFDIMQDNGKTKITFVHNGLTPDIECYDQCSNAWSQYLHQLKENLQGQ